MENKKLIWIPGVFIALSFLVEVIEKYVSFLNRTVALYFFWIGVGIGCLLIFLELFSLVHSFIETHFVTPSKRAKEVNERIEKERAEIKKLLDFCIDDHSLPDIKHHYYEMEDAYFSKEALAPYLSDWYNMVKTMNEWISEAEKKEELEEFEEEKEELQEEINKLRREKQILEASEDEQLISEKEEFLEEYGDRIQIDSSDFSDEQKSWLEEKGFQKSHQWCINNKETSEFMIKPRHNESLSHAYLIGAISEYLENDVQDIETPITKTADIVFTLVDSKFAIEVETGKVHEKSKKQLQKKVEALNKEFGKLWFFVVTNKNLVSKYKKFGEVVDRSNVIEYLHGVLNN
ncbi:MAG: hypothetical protein ACOCUR_03130 [Nanoarchaeota archaeon]